MSSELASSPAQALASRPLDAVDRAAEGDLWQPVTVDRALLRKYDRPGPRYTSYPTAPQFQTFGAGEYVRMLQRSAASDRSLSLYVHLPFCRQLCWYCGCNMMVARNPERGTDYLRYVEREMASVAAWVGAERRRVVQVHWGGGTPTFLLPADLRSLMRMIREHFALDREAEIGVEIDPRTCTEEHLDAMVEGGVNRLSIGVQDLDPQVQEAIHRVQPAELSWQVIEGARRRGIHSINVDLMYGLPHQNVESYRETLRETIRMRPDRFAAFNFAYLPQMIKHQRVIDRDTLPTPEVKLALLELIIDELTAAGYVFIGMDHFALPEDPLAQALRHRTMTRNFQGYSTWAETDVLAFGASSISQTEHGFAQNLKGVGEYQEAIERSGLAVFRGLEVTAEDRLRRDVIMSIMCHFRLEKAEIEQRHGIVFDEHFAEEIADLAPLVADGLLEVGDDRIEITRAGRLLVRNVAMTFDAYLRAGSTHAYSRTV